MPSTVETIAFFGATGGCAGACLAKALHNGYRCSALARTPEKLTNSLAKKGVDAKVQSSNLTIVKGDIRDVEAVKKTLVIDGKGADFIVSGIGITTFTFAWSITAPAKPTDPNICREASATILRALAQLQPELTSTTSKPLLVNVSTTGIPSPGCPRDVPLFLVPLYHWLLHYPHVDKRVMQENLKAHMQQSPDQRVLSAFTDVKASLLMDGEGVGWEKLRVGHSRKPAVGYTVKRADVGDFIFERLVKGEWEGEWVDDSVTVTS